MATVAQLARSVQADGAAPHDVEELARIGTSGRHPTNFERDLHRLARRKNLALPVHQYFITLELDHPDFMDPVETQVPVLLPVDVLCALGKSGLDCDKIFGCGDQREHFWENARTNPMWANHPIFETDSADLRDTIPVHALSLLSSVFLQCCT